MLHIPNLDTLPLLRESVSIECKLAIGRDGKGALPDDFWPTYSAMANTDGGLVFLGMRERQGRFEPVGIENVAKVRTELFNNLNNRQKVSINLIGNANVQEWDVAGKTLLIIEIPRATRRQRPVHLTQNPLNNNTYRRQNEGDFPLPDEKMRRMIAERVEDSRDSRILDKFGLRDLDQETLRGYRQVYRILNPDHPWANLDDQTFLQMIGGWREDRQQGEQGLTVAGLLMFGTMPSIQEALPYYMLDYQEQPESTDALRWSDRLTLDGAWSGNLYDFFRKVYLKLTADLKVPFRLENGIRQNETPVHTAMREALLNTLVHADYTDRASVKIVKRPGTFRFRNPGTMRIPVEAAIQGGEADCRNRTLHKMFRLVGLGEQAGTGIPKIFQGWQSQHWKPPTLFDSYTPFNQTVLELGMLDLFPQDVMEALHVMFGDELEQLGHDERLALALAAAENTISHARLTTVSSAHPVELTRMLQRLTQAGMLQATGSGRGTIYCLPGHGLPTVDAVFGASGSSDSKQRRLLPPNNLVSNEPLILSEQHAPNQRPSKPSKVRDQHGRLCTDQLPLPVIDDLAALSPLMRQHLESLCQQPRQKQRLTRPAMKDVLLSVCAHHYVTLGALSSLVNRKPDFLRDSYLSPLVKERLLKLAFPTTPTHDRQAYSTVAVTKAMTTDPC